MIASEARAKSAKEYSAKNYLKRVVKAEKQARASSNPLQRFKGIRA
jgi:hypothetical protein